LLTHHLFLSLQYTFLPSFAPRPKGEKLAASLTERTGNANISVESCDFDRLQSAYALAERVSTKHGGVLHLLVNCVSTVPKKKLLTSDGIESQFAVNVLSYFALTAALQPLLKAAAKASSDADKGTVVASASSASIGPGSGAKAAATAHSAEAVEVGAGARVVNVAAFLAGEVDLKDTEFTARPYDAQRGFKQTKAFVRMITAEAAKRYRGDGIAVNCCHPGVVTSPVLAGLGTETKLTSL